MSTGGGEIFAYIYCEERHSSMVCHIFSVPKGYRGLQWLTVVNTGLRLTMFFAQSFSLQYLALPVRVGELQFKIVALSVSISFAFLTVFSMG